jgi:hypothetical protein
MSEHKELECIFEQLHGKELSSAHVEKQEDTDKLVIHCEQDANKEPWWKKIPVHNFDVIRW